MNINRQKEINQSNLFSRNPRNEKEKKKKKFFLLQGVEWWW